MGFWYDVPVSGRLVAWTILLYFVRGLDGF